MEELDLKELLNYYLKKLPVIIMMTLLVILLGYSYIEYYQVPMYHGKTTIILIQKNDNLNGTQNNLNETANQLNVNEKLVATYSEIIKSRRVLEQVKNTLELKDSLKALENSIEVDSVSDTAIIEITVSNESAEQATQIANQLAQVFKTEISKLYNLENISIIDEAIVETSPYNVNVMKQMIIYTMIGIILSCSFIFVIYYFDNTIKNRKEIETKLDIPVLGEVPLSLKLVKKSRKEDSSKKKTKTKFSIRIKKRIQKLKEKQAQKKKLSQEKRLKLKESKRLKKIQKQEQVKPISSKEETPKKISRENKKEPKETKTTTVKKKNSKVKNEVNPNKTNKKTASSKETIEKKATKPRSQKKKVTTKKSQEKE